MSSTKYFRINTPQIVNETIDGEVVIINFENGNYYSCNALGCEIWSLIEQRQSVEDIIKVVNNRYESNALNLGAIVRAFLDELEQNQLIVSTEKGATSTPDLTASYPKHSVTTPPELHKFEDMQELLLLDPIHDVDSAGWPTMDSKKK